jgi:hypothetical protein
MRRGRVGDGGEVPVGTEVFAQDGVVWLAHLPALCDGRVE